MSLPTTFRRFLWPRSLAGKAGMALLCFLVVLAATYLAAAYFTSKRLAEAKKLSEAFGLSHDLDALLGPFIAPEDNAAIPLNQAGVLANRLYLDARQKHKLDVNANVSDHAVLVAEYEAILNDPAYNRLLEEADRRKGYRSINVFKRPMLMANPNSPSFTMPRAAARIEQELVDRLVQAGRPDEAARRVLRLLRTTRKWEDKEPFLVAGLMNIGVRGVAFESLNAVLRSGKPLPATLHAEIDEELGRQEQIKRVIPWLIQTGAVLGCDFYEVGPWTRIPFADLFAKEGQKTTLQFAHRLQLTVDKPYLDAWNEIQRLHREVKNAGGNPLSRIVYFGAEGLLASEPLGRRAFERIVARARCLRVLNAMASRGDFKAEITSLGIPNDSSADPFDGKRLRIKASPHGPIVYSVGDDLKDDDGNLGPPGFVDQGYGPVPRNTAKQ